ncbi:MAG: transposase, partial [Candidatus Cloacimonadota bacterium]|nr:transposase [Candidatus Cloacimonadota bacterium]
EQFTKQSVEQFTKQSVEQFTKQSVEQFTKQSVEQFTEQFTEQSDFIRKPKSISSFLGGFKSVVNSKIDDYIDDNNLNIPKYNRNNHFFQPNYYDHIIRNNAEYERIKNYIKNNPQKWEGDKFYENNIRKNI